MSMDPAVTTLIIINLLTGFGGAITLAIYLANVSRRSRGILRHFINLIMLYLIEGVGLAACMGIPIFSVGFAFIWGLALGLRLRTQMTPYGALKTSFFISIYSSLPAASLLLIPLVALLGGWNIVAPSEAIRMGIPEFIPAPANTILGFFAVLSIGAVVFKMVITTGIVSMLILLRERHIIGRP
jgi:hypothetical protein